METNPRDYGERCRFDAFCKTVLKHEAIDYIREMKRQASRETSLERLPQTAMNKLCSADDYPSDSYVFSYCGYGLPIRSQQVADAFASLPEQEQSILILRLPPAGGGRLIAEICRLPGGPSLLPPRHAQAARLEPLAHERAL